MRARRAGLRLGALALVLAGALLVAGCSKLVMMRPYDLTARPETTPRTSTRMALQGFVTDDGEYHAFTGWVEIRPDSLKFYQAAGRGKILAAHPGFAREQVKMLFVSQADADAGAGVVGSLLLGAAVLVGTVLLLVGRALD